MTEDRECNKCEHYKLSDYGKMCSRWECEYKEKGKVEE